MKPFKKKNHTESHPEVQKKKVLKGDWQKVFCFLWAGSQKSFSPEKERTTKRRFNFKLSVFNENILDYITQQPHTDYTFLTLMA